MAEQLIHSLQFPGLPDTYVIPEVGRNLLDNACFVGGGSQQGGGQFPINQRAQTLYPAGTSYCIDRWKHTTAYTITQLYSDYLLLSTTGGSSDYGYIMQFISWNAIREKVVTYSVLYLDSSNKPQLASRSGTTFSTPPAQGADNAVIRMNDLIPNGAGCGFYINSAGQAFAQIGQTPGNSIKLLAAKLELGDTQTLAHLENEAWVVNEIPNYEFELLRCKTATVDAKDIYANNLNIADKNYCRKNLLRNWYFIGGGTKGVFPINTRGATTYTGVVYEIDGWKGDETGTTVDILSDCISVTSTSSEQARPAQIIDYPAVLFEGKTITISAIAKGNFRFNISIGSIAFRSDYYDLGISSWQLVSYTVTLTDTPTRDYLTFWLTVPSGSNNAQFQAVKVELGTQQTLAYQENATWILKDIPNYEEELLKCQTSRAWVDDIYANGTVSINTPRPNLLRNWYFLGTGESGTFPVNFLQQNNYSGSSQAYGVTAWVIRNGATATFTEDGLQLYFPSGDTALKGLNQRFTNLSEFLGKTVTVSALVTGFSGFSDTINYPKMGLYFGNSAAVHSSVALTETITGTGLFTVSGVLPSTTTYSGLNFTACYANSFSGTVKIAAVKFEIGMGQTLAHKVGDQWVLNDLPDYDEEVNRCLTYKGLGNNGRLGGNMVGGFIAASGYPYFRFQTDDGNVYQIIIYASTGNLAVQQYDASTDTWSTIKQYAPVT